ncbi:MAG TPA: HD domain-containing phosphohydrolase [Clostridia bacterium]|nr:HD domain-containing phosphohydrolase [Clostridia bacterium]
MSKTIFVVDDEQMITSTLAALIKMVLKFDVRAFNDPNQALESEALASNHVDLIISDFMMPGMNGIEFLKKASKISPNTITILLTGYADKENAIRSINEVGLYYYLEKPWDNNDLIKIISNGIEKKVLSDDLHKRYEELRESKEETERLYGLLKTDYQQEADNARNLVITLANVIEAKDKYTDGHTRRVGNISRLLGERLGLPEEKLRLLEMSGLIHDIGKVGVPELILNKPGKLDEDEFEAIKRHTVIGETICRPLNSLSMCLDPIRHHHEKIDGTGYPDGLAGDQLSIDSRIIAVADIYDALTSDRPYRDKMPIEQVKEIILGDMNRGKLDKTVVKELIKAIDEEEV